VAPFLQIAATDCSEFNFNELKAPCDATVVGDCTGLEAPYDDKLGEQEPVPHPAPDFFACDSLLMIFPGIMVVSEIAMSHQQSDSRREPSNAFPLN
jgi:hypothetical protein